MCGIVALISPSVPISTELLTVMRDRLIHRGPDNGGNWLSSNRRIGLAHRRLSILDTTHNADQPMTTADGSLTLIFNGEIYNYIEIRIELENIGVRFETRSDTEVLLSALQHWGADALIKLNGMFAFALWDSRLKRLLVARDRFGEKPLFIGRGDLNTLVFASEMKAILLHPQMQCTINEKAIARFVCGDWREDDELTFFIGIERFPAAHAAWYAEDGTEISKWRYWSPKKLDIENKLQPREAVEKFGELLENSIKSRAMADVQVGSSLSGGLDSSAIVGILSQSRQNNSFTQNTFSAHFPNDLTLSEGKEISSVASFTGVNSYLVSPEPDGLIKESALLHWHQEEPFLSASIYLQWCVARLAKEKNTTVLLDGQGADELLGGYQYYFKQRQLDLINQNKIQLAFRETAKFNRRLTNESEKYHSSGRRFNSSVAYSDTELKALARTRKHPLVNKKSQNDDGSLNKLSEYRKTLAHAMTHDSLPMLLRYADRNSMAFSREVRLPFLDYNLVEFCNTLPDDFLVRNGWQKWILREASQGLMPKNIQWRVDKVGFAAPLDNWLRNEMKGWALERLMDKRLAKIPGYNLQDISDLWSHHQTGLANNSWALWKWISLSEWLGIYYSGWWKGRPNSIAT